MGSKTKTLSSFADLEGLKIQAEKLEKEDKKRVTREEFAKLGSVTEKSGHTFLSINTASGTIELDINNRKPNNSLASITQDGKDIFDDSWVGIKNTPEEIKEALMNNSLIERPKDSETEKKAESAIATIDKTVELNGEAETALSEGVDKNPDFIDEAGKLDLLRGLVASVAEHTINKETDNAEKVKESEKKVKKAVAELETKINDPFTKAVFDKMADRNKNLLLEYLIKQPVSQTESKILKPSAVTRSNENLVHFSDNGYLMKLMNKKDVSTKGRVAIDSEAAMYRIVSPDDKIIAERLHYNVALSTLQKKAQSYHVQLNTEFNAIVEPEVEKGMITLSEKQLQAWFKELENKNYTEEDIKNTKGFDKVIPSQQERLLKFNQDIIKKLETQLFNEEEFAKFLEAVKSGWTREEVINEPAFKDKCNRKQKGEVLRHFDTVKITFSEQKFSEYFDEVEDNHLTRKEVINSKKFKENCSEAQQADLLAYFDELEKTVPAKPKVEAVGIPKDIPEKDALSAGEFKKYFDEIEAQKIEREVVIADDKFKNNCNINQKKEILEHFDSLKTADLSMEPEPVIEKKALTEDNLNYFIKRAEDNLTKEEDVKDTDWFKNLVPEQLERMMRAFNKAKELPISDESLNYFINRAENKLLTEDHIKDEPWYKRLKSEQKDSLQSAFKKANEITLPEENLVYFIKRAEKKLLTEDQLREAKWFEDLKPEQQEILLNTIKKANETSITDESLNYFIKRAEDKLLHEDDVKEHSWYKNLNPEQKNKLISAFEGAKTTPDTMILNEDALSYFEERIKTEHTTEAELKENEGFKKIIPEQQKRLLRACEVIPVALDNSILGYAESIGIKNEEFAEFPDFLALKPEQQKVILETLRRSSYVLAKAQGREKYTDEKNKKPFYKLGFYFNQNYHKKRHEVEAIKTIESKGLEGYSKSEFALLINVVKNGVEVKENGEITFLPEDRMSNEVSKQAIHDYNLAARAYVEISKFSTDPKEIQKRSQAERILNSAKEEILRSASCLEDLNAVRVAESNFKLFKLLSADKETERIVNKLSSETLSGGSKAKMMWGAHSDKLGYMGMGMSMKVAAKLAIGINYAIAPAVAAIVGAYRAYETNRKDIDEKNIFAQIGFKDTEKGTAKFAKTMNQAVGKNEKGKDIGLSEKLDKLVAQLETLNQKRHFATEAEDIDKIDQELKKIEQLLVHRIDYTIGRMNDKEVSYGPAEERAVNFYELNNSLISAQAKIFRDFDPFNTLSNHKEIDSRTKKLTRSNIEYKKLPKIKGESQPSYDERVRQMNAEYVDASETGHVPESVYYNKFDYQVDNRKYVNLVNDENRLSQLKLIGFESRLASFMDYKENKRHNKEIVYMTKKVALGAVKGATFAAAGIWVAEKLGIDTFFAERIDWVKGIFSHHDVSASVTVGSGAKAVEHLVPQNGGAHNIPAETPTVKTPAAGVPVKGGGHGVEVGRDEISNKDLNGKHDSVWRSLREIFKKHPELGYKGNVNDAKALNQWAETQTANTIGNNPEIVHEGDIVKLINDNGHLRAITEQGTGHPTHTNSHNLPKSGRANVIHAIKTNAATEILPNAGSSNVEQLVAVKEEMEKNAASSLLEQNTLAKIFHFNPNNFTRISPNHFSYVTPGKGEMILSYKDGSAVIERLYDAKEMAIPNELIAEIRKSMSVDRFVSRGGINKVLSTWNNLTPKEQTIYKDLISFKKYGMTPAELLNKICSVFNVNANNGVMINTDANHFVYKGHRNFDMNLNGLTKLIKVLTRRDS